MGEECLDNGNDGKMAFQERSTQQNPAIGQLRKKAHCKENPLQYRRNLGMIEWIRKLSGICRMNRQVRKRRWVKQAAGAAQGSTRGGVAETTNGIRGERGDWWPYVMDVPAPLAWPPRPVALFEYMFGASPHIFGYGTCSISAMLTT